MKHSSSYWSTQLFIIHGPLFLPLNSLHLCGWSHFSCSLSFPLKTRGCNPNPISQLMEYERALSISLPGTTDPKGNEPSSIHLSIRMGPNSLQYFLTDVKWIFTLRSSGRTDQGIVVPPETAFSQSEMCVFFMLKLRPLC